MADTETVTMKVKLHYMAIDPGATQADRKLLLEGWEYQTDEPLLDGPVSRRLAVVDIDPENGAVNAGAPFLYPSKGKKMGRYAVKDEHKSDSPDFMQVSVFGAVMKMIDMFEEEDVLGRKLRWAFPGEQLLIVPRAGIMRNAFYHRESRSLQFFFFDDPQKKGSHIYTCLSPHIVAHEATHAILDAIAPDLHEATSPQSLAIHEAIADIGAMLFSTRSQRTRREVIAFTGGDLRNSNGFTEIALQFGAAVYGEGRPLRNLYNDLTVSDVSNEPHVLSQVLSGALYSVMVTLQDQRVRDVMMREGKTRYSALGIALFVATAQLRRFAFRGLDYLPPGEVSFADYGRAIIAADTSLNPHDHELREIAKAEFVKRKIVENPDELDSVFPAGFVLPPDLDLEQLLFSDWAAYQFCERFRAELMIPPDVSFNVRSRLDADKMTYRHSGEKAYTRELILKVAWRENKVITAAGGLVDEISVVHGTTLAINWDQRTICGLVSTSPRDPSQHTAAARTNDVMRVAYLTHLLDEGVIEIGEPNVQLQGRTLRVRGMGQMLHMVEH